jgi:acylphosphatase
VSQELASLKALVMGKVQGVGFRYFTERVAEAMGLSGYVMNCREGSVEVVAEGERGALEEFLRRLTQGPSAARVEKVETAWGPYTGAYRGFSIRLPG